MQKNVYPDMARNAELARKRNPDVIVENGTLWLENEKIGRIENGEVFHITSNRKIATIADNSLWLIDGQTPLLAVTYVNGGGRIEPSENPHALAKLILAAG